MRKNQKQESFWKIFRALIAQVLKMLWK